MHLEIRRFSGALYDSLIQNVFLRVIPEGSKEVPSVASPSREFCSILTQTEHLFILVKELKSQKPQEL